MKKYDCSYETAALQRRVDELARELEKMKNVLANGKEVMTLEEVATFLGISKSTLYKMTHSLAIPFFKPNNKMVYFERAELLQWMRRNRSASMEEIEGMASRRMLELAMNEGHRRMCLKTGF